LKIRTDDYLARNSPNHEHDLALHVSFPGPFMGFAGIGKRKRAVDADADRSGLQQACEFGKLRAEPPNSLSTSPMVFNKS
jgi:hypothetical protein